MLPARSLVKNEDGKVELRFADGQKQFADAFADDMRLRLGLKSRSVWSLRLAAANQRYNLINVHGQPNGEGLQGVVAVVPYYGDHRFIPWFLAYYRKIGICYFVFLDLSKTSDLAAYVADAADVAVWQIRNKLRVSDALHALNYLRHRYARDGWCLSVEPYDLFVFPKSETRHLQDLVDFMTYERQDHLFAMIVDAYGEKPARQINVGETFSPLEHLPFFDRVGYETTLSEKKKTAIIQGGVQRRLLFADQPMNAPLLNCAPLVKMKRDYYYTSATRQMVPGHLNQAHSEWHTSISACILRFAMLSSSECLHIARLIEAAGLNSDRVPPLYAGSEALAMTALKVEGSGHFNTSQDLVECGLLNVGQWF
jgi:hypothetical protein